MEKETRNAIERATQRARGILEKDFAEQLQGDYDVMQDGRVGERPGAHLTGAQRALRARIVAAIEHKRAQGMKPNEAVADYLRDAAFTTLNRFVALKMLEARELVQECVSKGEASSGFVNEFCGLAPGLKLPDGSGYRLYIESIFDELSTEVKVLFDRRDPASALWPRKAAFDGLLASLNADDLKDVWGEDETIGWVYQFFNGQDERRKMRDGEPSAAQQPRAGGPQPVLHAPIRRPVPHRQHARPHLVRDARREHGAGGAMRVHGPQARRGIRAAGEEGPARPARARSCLRQRPLPPLRLRSAGRDLRGGARRSGEPEERSDGPHPRARTTRASKRSGKAVPGLILAHNLHGVDIDPRCAQIAQLALWMRAQKAYRDFGIGRAERPQIRRSNIVVAEPLVADEQTAKEFVAEAWRSGAWAPIRRARRVAESRW